MRDLFEKWYTEYYWNFKAYGVTVMQNGEYNNSVVELAYRAFCVGFYEGVKSK